MLSGSTQSSTSSLTWKVKSYQPARTVDLARDWKPVLHCMQDLASYMCPSLNLKLDQADLLMSTFRMWPLVAINDVIKLVNRL
ncbi:hypothetical protein EMIT0P265_70329 [Pseudomonas zeae]